MGVDQLPGIRLHTLGGRQGRRQRQNPGYQGVIMKTTGHENCTGGHFGRRDFLRIGSLSFLGINLGQFLKLRNVYSSPALDKQAKAQACILVWLDGGASQMDTFDPKPSSNFRPITTDVPGIQVSELFPNMAKIMNKCAVIRSMHTEENDHGAGTHNVATGHRPNPAMKFPGLGSMITHELGARNAVSYTHLTLPTILLV